MAWESENESGSQFDIGRTGLDRVGLTEKVMLEQGFELGEGVSHIQRCNVLGKRNSQYKGQRVGVCKACLRAKNKEACVAWSGEATAFPTPGCTGS